eukprot:1150765-Pelagomonas_calceolata.AAC.6
MGIQRPSSKALGHWHPKAFKQGTGSLASKGLQARHWVMGIQRPSSKGTGSWASKGLQAKH